ncbi:MAG TPA: hypothetical protein PKY56_07625 [Candidatus Kapabacteria bacterium]|nr:hypothetical protein [Candidatus Kapabacteria bacterium]HPO62850.1 hypothetical protein [Candidatus Kapabacteria bacterium]
MDKLIDKFEAYPVGTGYIDVIVMRDKVVDFILELTRIGLVIESISWWCHSTEENKVRFGCLHGYGGPSTQNGWFSEMTHDFDNIENKILKGTTDTYKQSSIAEINDKAKNLILNKHTITYPDGNFLTYKDNPCLTPGLWIQVPENWERE